MKQQRKFQSTWKKMMINSNKSWLLEKIHFFLHALLLFAELLVFPLRGIRKVLENRRKYFFCFFFVFYLVDLFLFFSIYLLTEKPISIFIITSHTIISLTAYLVVMFSINGILVLRRKKNVKRSFESFLSLYPVSIMVQLSILIPRVGVLFFLLFFVYRSIIFCLFLRCCNVKVFASILYTFTFSLLCMLSIFYISLLDYLFVIAVGWLF